MDAFGSNAQTVGGFAGRSDGICGAVECQKSSGSLHLHFWNFVQRVHQHKSLAEISSMLKDALINAEQMKAFCATVCCESYPDGAAVEKKMDTLEAQWPRFSEENDTDAPGIAKLWGANRLGRLPPFIWNDIGFTVSDLRPNLAPEEKARIKKRLHEDAETYNKQFSQALQHNQMCVQHHIHPRNSKTGARFLPNACRNSLCKDRCRYEFPQDARMNETPVLVCKGIAKDKGLPRPGSDQC